MTTTARTASAVTSHCEQWLWARRLDGETTSPDFVEIDFAVQAVPTGLGLSGPKGTAWVAVATWRGAHPTDGGQRAVHVERVGDPRATPELAAEDLRIAAEGTRWLSPFIPAT